MNVTAENSAAEKPFYDFVKRCFDIVSSFCALIVFALPMFVISCLIKKDSRGPAIFKQERLGLNGKPFTLYKFRSMRIDAENDGPCWAEEDDPRVTKLGRKLRDRRLDELPQLWNILKGDMSVVGPRPEREYFYREFEKEIPDFRSRLKIMPGLTGWAQVNGGYSLSPAQKLEKDKAYMRNRCILLDIAIIFRTVEIILTGKDAY